MDSEIKRVLNLGDLHKRPHWKVYHGTNKKAQQIYCSSDSIMQPVDSITWESSKPILQNYLSLAPDGTYTIDFKNKSDDKNDNFSIVFRIETATEVNGTQNAPATQFAGHMPMQMMFTMMQQQMTAQIGKITSELQSQFALAEKERKIAELEEKLRKRGESKSSTWTEVWKEAKQTFYELKALHESGQASQPAIGLSGTNEKPVPTPDKKEDSMPEQLTVDNPKLVELQLETIKEFSEMFGGPENMIIELFCLKELMKDEKALFDTFVKPRTAKYKEVLNGMGITAR